MYRFWVMVTALLTTLTLTGPALPASASAPADIARQLKAIPGMKVKEKTSDQDGYRWFWLTYRQPVDHRHPSRGWFEQRVMLEHRSQDSPMVLYTSGYDVSEYSSLSEPAELLDANQVSVEYRYFTPSRPKPTDWSKDTIWQAATDEHRLIKALKAIYQAKWISTGASKGGMTAVYHRRFYPGDVDGTVAYVAPNDVDNAKDAVYYRFLQNAGKNTACRDRLRGLQRAFLRHRSALVKRFKSLGITFRIVGSADVAFEHTVMDFEWMFWQYDSEKNCKRLPNPKTASADRLFFALQWVVGVSSYSDRALKRFMPYYYQAGTQLGWPAQGFKHLRPQLRHEKSYYRPRFYVDKKIKMRFQPNAMRDIDTWVRSHGTRLLFVYGQNDPWSAKPFRLGRGSRDSAVYTVPGGNHGAQIAGLPGAQRDRATDTLLRWAEIPVTPQRLTRSSVVDPLMTERPRL